MIIACEQCNKKFEIEANMIPNEGRLLQCGSCNYKWFFKKDLEEKFTQTLSKKVINKKEDISIEIPLPKESEETDLFEKDIDEGVKENKNDTKEASLNEKNIKNTKPPKKRIGFLNIILVFIISLIAVIILIDTFKGLIGLLIPNIDFILESLYETLMDVYLFFKDLIK